MKFSTAALVCLTATVCNAFVPSSRSFVPHATTQTRITSQFMSTPQPVSDAGAKTTTTTAVVDGSQTYEFQAEVGKVMDIIINSLYSDRDVFLRELVSNAADAIDKKRFLGSSGEGEDRKEILIKAVPEKCAIIIEDSGVGMTREELVNNLGRIAQSGTKAFAEALGGQDSDDAMNLIGQFGVGFYSAYLVANKVEVVTKSMQPNSKQLRWTSEATSSFTISEDENTESEPIVGSGTRLILHMKEDAFDYLEFAKLEELLKRYSEFIEFPISLWKEKTEYKKVPDLEANKDLKEGEKPKMKTVPETTAEYERVNTNKPIWRRDPTEVKDEEYKEFYKGAFKNSYDEPMKWTHFGLDGQVVCKSILFVPGMLPFELSRDMFDDQSRGIRLYVKRVFINDKFDGLVPRWLKFIRGVVDSDDLPLNVSREILQRSAVLSIINKRLVKKSLEMMYTIANDEDTSKYIMFWNNFGKYLKVGAIEDDRNREEILPLLRFFSSKSGEEYTSLDKYVENKVEGQKSIYFVTGESREQAAMSPVIEKLTSRGYDVLFACEPLDEILMESIRKYKDMQLVDATKENLDLGDEPKEEDEKKKTELKETFKETIEFMEILLDGKVQKVVISDLLSKSPAALVQGAYGVSPTMQRYMKAQAVATGAKSQGLNSMNQAVLELNPKHAIVKELDRKVKSARSAKSTEDFANLLYDVACMTSGYDITDMKKFAGRVMGLMGDQDVEDDEDEEETYEEEEEFERPTASKAAEIVDVGGENAASASA